MDINRSLIHDTFTSAQIAPEIFARINGKSYTADCTVPLEELRYLTVLYCGFDGTTQQGELIVNTRIAEDTVHIFKELYAARYPIEKMHLVDEYNAVDDISMAENNSSAFNYRFIDGTTQYSTHATGMAIDINPLYNPYIRIRNGQEFVLPPNARLYTERTLPNKYYIKKDDFCYQTFARYGFTWGGDWIDRKDYQHFEKASSKK